MQKSKAKKSDTFGAALAKVLAANSGEPKAVAELREELSGSNAGDVIAVIGDLAHQAEESLLEALYGDQAGFKEVIREKIRGLRDEFGWCESSALERILIERIGTSWLHLQFAELTCIQATNCPLPLAKFYQFRIDRAQRRHLSAVKMLATVRKMGLPVKVEIKADINVNEPQRPARSRFEMADSYN